MTSSSFVSGNGNHWPKSNLQPPKKIEIAFDKDDEDFYKEEIGCETPFILYRGTGRRRFR